MGKQHRSPHERGFWTRTYGGMPGWGLVASAVVFVACMVVVAVGGNQQSTTASTWEPPPSATPTATGDATPVGPIVATEGRESPVALIVGDSYTAGVGASEPRNSWASIVTRALKWDATVLAAPGGGYSLPGVNGESILGMLESADLRALRPDVVVIQSGYNDTSAQDADVRAAINDVRGILTEELPGVPVVVVGQFWPGEPTPSSEARARTIQAAWSGRDGTLVLDPIEGGWSSFNTTDDRHPDDAGHALIAKNIVAAMRAEGLVR